MKGKEVYHCVTCRKWSRVRAGHDWKALPVFENISKVVSITCPACQNMRVVPGTSYPQEVSHVPSHTLPMLPM